MRNLIVLAVLVAAFVAPALADSNSLGATASRFSRNRLVFYDTAEGREVIQPLFPVQFYDDFCGYAMNKYVTGENTTSRWKTVETNLNTGIAVSADAHVAALILDADDNAERAVLYFGDQECFDGYLGCTFEARVKFSVAGTLVTSCVVGLAGADNADSDAIDVNAWFKCASGAPTVLLWECDDDSTNDDDNDASTTVATTTWYVLRVEVDLTNGAKFYVDGTLVGTGNMSALTTTTGMLQPYIAIEKAGGLGVGTLLVDYVRVWGNRK